MSPSPTIRKTDKGEVEVEHVSHTEKQKVGALTSEVNENNNETLWHSIKQNPWVLVYTFLANSGSLLFGYDVLVQGAITALPIAYFGSPFGDSFILPALWQGLWQGLNAFGIMCGAASNGVLQDKFGRKVMFFVGGAISAIGTAITFVASDVDVLNARRGLLVLGKFILGASMGILMSTCQTYVSEISPPRLRTILLGLYPFLITVGQMIAISVVFSRINGTTDSAFKVPFASQWAFSAFAIIVSFIIPESPLHLIAKDKLPQAEKSLLRLGCPTPTRRIMVIQATREQERASSAEEATVAELFQGSNLRRTRIVALLNSLQQFIGISLVSNSTYFFIMAGMDPSQSLTMNQAGVGASMGCTLISWVIITHLGRRTAILGSFVMAALFFLGMGIAGFWPHDPKALRFIGVSLILAACCNNLGVGTAYPIAAAEIPSTRLRAKTLGFGFLINAFTTWAFTLCVPYMFNADEGNLGGKIGFVFVGFCVVGFVLSWLEIPETKDITYAQIDHLFQQRIPTRRFKDESVREIPLDK
ncbi:general substrate transporter [Aspergillus pseudodeflectus]|uniref:General substrate transporter n=1 Tax=Aspergillus pseudodeflectus TaxID=176178 RepID=A0ABR4KG62_9EURO